MDSSRKGIGDSVLIEDFLRAFDNMCYDLIFAVDLQSCKVVYRSEYHSLYEEIDSSGSGPINGKDCENVSDFVRYLSGDDCEQFDRIIEAMLALYGKLPSDMRSRLCIMSDLKSVYKGNGTILYKMSPLVEDETRGLPKFILCRVEFPMGTDSVVYAQIVGTGDRYVYDMDDKVWHKSSVEKLTDVEKSVMAQAAKGLTVTEIAARLCKSTDAVKSEKKRIFQKLGVNNMAQAMLLATNHKLL